MKITISKSQWEGIGKKAGWNKKADWNAPVTKDIDFTSVYKRIGNQIENNIRNLNGVMDVDVIWRNPHSLVMKFEGYSKSDFEASGMLLVSFTGANTDVTLYAKTMYGEHTVMDGVVTEGKLPLQNIMRNIWGIFQ